MHKTKKYSRGLSNTKTGIMKPKIGLIKTLPQYGTYRHKNIFFVPNNGYTQSKNDATAWEKYLLLGTKKGTTESSSNSTNLA